MFSRLNVICGHYGSGKTNLALNMALKLAESGKAVTIVDMDIVNPYFRTTDYVEILKEKGIEVISPSMAGTTLDTPALAPRIMSAFADKSRTVIFDVGGDDVGATALGRFSRNFAEEEYQMFFVINKFRKQISDIDGCKEILSEIEYASKLKITAIANNSHYGEFTTAEDIIESNEYGLKVSEALGLPLKLTAVEERLCNELQGKVENIYPIEIIVKLPWAV